MPDEHVPAREGHARIEWGDTISNPKLVEDDRLMKFDVVVANPPFSLDKWGADAAGRTTSSGSGGGAAQEQGRLRLHHPHDRSAVDDEGRVGVIVPHGVLFRGGTEGIIRQKLIEENLLEAVIGLPANLFYGTGIPAAILLFHKGKPTTDVLFIDASQDSTKRSRTGCGRRTSTRSFPLPRVKSVPKYAHRATVGDRGERVQSEHPPLRGHD